MEESETQENDTSETHTTLSKRAQKKLLKRQEWLDGRAERRAKEKAKRKEKMQKRKLEEPNLPSYSESRKRLKKNYGDKEKSQIHIAFDMSFGGYMNQRDRGKCFKQLLRCYSLNRRLESPINLHFTGFSGVMKEELASRHQGFENWDINFHSESISEAFADGKQNPLCKGKQDIVYLTSESENVIKGELQKDKVYVIGALVDHNLHKGLCHRLATEAGLSHGRLPIEEFVDMKTRKVLTIDHVFQILTQVASQEKDWADALLTTLPTRKGAELKATEDEHECIDGSSKNN